MLVGIRGPRRPFFTAPEKVNGGNNAPYKKYRLKKLPQNLDSSRPKKIERFLLIEDSPSVITFFTNFFIPKLQTESIVLSPTKMEEVLEAIKAFNPDLILMDYKLTPFESPEFNGVVIIRELRKAGFAGFICANSSDPSNNQDMLRAGADFSVKNKNILELKPLLEEVSE